MLTYEEAVDRWGRKQLKHYSGVQKEIAVEKLITVDFILDEGYSCCGGSDPNCYCSFAESPSCKAKIKYPTVKGGVKEITISWLDFAETLRDIYACGIV